MIIANYYQTYKAVSSLKSIDLEFVNIRFKLEL